ncbi:MAG: glycosyltransferase, partial [Sphingobium sp.]
MVANERALVLAVAAYFPDSYGGAERQARILAEALGRKGVTVTLVAPTIRDDVPLIEQTAFGEIRRKRLRAFPNLGGRNFLSFLMWSLWVPWLLRDRKWRGIPVYVFHARLHALGPALAALRNRSPLLIKLGGGGEASEFDALRCKKYLYGHLVERLLLRRVDTFVANSGQIADELRRLPIGTDRIAEFPNGVALPPLEVLRGAMARRNGRRFIYAARLKSDKNVSVLYGAAMILAGRGVNMHLRLVGDGPERDRLERLTAASPFASVISFPGFVSDIYPEMQAADFFVCASKREGQSNALLEAMSAGVIPIVFKASGVEEVVSHGRNGFIVDVSEPESFAQAMQQAIDMTAEEREAMSLAARDFAEKNIGIDAVADRTWEVVTAINSRFRCGITAGGMRDGQGQVPDRPAGENFRLSSPKVVRGLSSEAIMNSSSIATPKVAVILTCYNEGPYIGAAVRSVLDQSRADLVTAIIIADDGSQPATIAVLKDIERWDPRISILYGTGGAGPSGQRCKAIATTDADVLAILDGDDLWTADKLERQLPVLMAQPDIGLVYTDFFAFPDENLAAARRAGVLDITGSRWLSHTYFLNDPPIIPSTTLLRRTAYEACGGFDAAVHIFEDTDIFIRMARVTRFALLDEPLLYKRNRGTSITGGRSDLMAHHAFVTLK